MLVGYIEIENFKLFGSKQRIELGHPTVLIGPNNSGKTSAIQALAFWAQALRTWFDAKKETNAKDRTSTALNRLNIVAVPVQQTRFFWHNAVVRTGRKDVSLKISVGIWFRKDLIPLTMEFRNNGDEIVYCKPDDAAQKNPAFLSHAASIRVELLYSMSGIETEEAILQPGRIDVLLGQGQTAQVLRNLALVVAREAPGDWGAIQGLMNRLFGIELDQPRETARGAIDLKYRQPNVKNALDISLAGRGLQQMLLIFAYLYSHKNCVLMIDEPDAHLEILRQKQIYVLLREIGRQNEAQVVLATHSEVVLEEALEENLTLLIDGKADNITAKNAIRNSLLHFGAAHYVKARERGYVLYVEGATDIDALRSLAERLHHPVVRIWDERINTYYVQNNYPLQDAEAEIARVEGGFGMTPKKHFFALRDMVPNLVGLAILDSDSLERSSSTEGGLTTLYWKKYEIENYFVTPEVLRAFSVAKIGQFELFDGFVREIEDILASLIAESLFGGSNSDMAAYADAPPPAARLIWEARTERLKLSKFAEKFFSALALKTGGAPLLSKGQYHLLIEYVDSASLAAEIGEKLDAIQEMFKQSR
jgi:predicted ATPase